MGKEDSSLCNLYFIVYAFCGIILILRHIPLSVIKKSVAHHKPLVLLLVSIVSAIYWYQSVFLPNNPETMDFLKTKLPFVLDGWGLSHFLLYTGIGYYIICNEKECPELLLIYAALYLMVGWELFEMCQKTRDPTGFWYGRWEDVGINLMGLVTGVTLKVYYSES